MAAGDLTTLANVKLWLGISSSTDDAQIQRLITAASNFITKYCNRSFSVVQYNQQKYNGNGNQHLVLRNWPIISVEQLKIDEAIVPSANYGFGERILYLFNGLVYSRGLSNVSVSYTAGYSEIPAAIEQACIELVAMKYRERDRIGHISKTMNGETVSFIVADLHPSIRKVLDLYSEKVPA
jgi:hypothetical protein